MIVLPRLGQVIWLRPHADNVQKSSQTFKSRIADVDGATAAMEIPTDEQTGRPGFFSQGTKWLVWYFGTDGSRYEFQTEVVGRRNENIPLVLIHIPDKNQFTRTQRRNFVRVDVNVEIAVKLEDKSRNYHFLTHTVDLSGGGLAITCPDTYHLIVGDRLKLWMALPMRSGVIEHVAAVGECTRIQEQESRSSRHFWISIKFVEISESDRAKIIRICFERQLEKHKILPETDQKEISG
ncbi:flagellar brake domain-containing protein [Brevibacillus humidisoli]|uniref:flagellar brake protein n=1 Tax=Brevibacillus humidisoli TaxID=2895522 RepID=UPI001E5CBE4A|nr:flagellar brake domain-containing protein [Brevibacillus humidisoli]UFJ42808.1 flagellar brake domain-containing protein [Brevibacillus humidisoli]